MRGLVPIGAALVALGCSDPPAQVFKWPQRAEDVRARLIQAIPEGREIQGAREFMVGHGFACDEPMPSAAEAHATVCRALKAPPAYTVVLIERKGRLADVSVR
jgi:hypothetical protein